METIGQKLKKEREKRNLTIKDICQETKIYKKYIEGIEKDDFSEFPAPIYIHGYVKLYSDELRLDWKQSNDLLKRSTTVEEVVSYEPFISRTARKSFSWLFFVIPAGILFSLAMIMLYGKIIH